jgi:hypothetical protein
MTNVGIFYGHLVKFMAIWYTVWPFGIVCGPLVYMYIYFPVLVCFDRKNLATLVMTTIDKRQ